MVSDSQRILKALVGKSKRPFVSMNLRKGKSHFSGFTLEGEFPRLSAVSVGKHIFKRETSRTRTACCGKWDELTTGDVEKELADLPWASASGRYWASWAS